MDNKSGFYYREIIRKEQKWESVPRNTNQEKKVSTTTTISLPLPPHGQIPHGASDVRPKQVPEKAYKIMNHKNQATVEERPSGERPIIVNRLDWSRDFDAGHFQIV